MLKKAKPWPKRADKLAKALRSEKFYQLLCGDLLAQKKLGSPLLWALTSPARQSEAASRVQAWFRSIAKQRKLASTSQQVLATIEQLGQGSAGRLRSNAESALLAVAAAQSLPSIANRCEEDQWQWAVESLAGLAESAIGDRELSPWVHQMLSIELPLTLATCLPELDVLSQFGSDAAGRMVESVSSMLDLDGWPHADYLPVFGPLAASWVRCQLMIRKRKFPFSPEAESQVSWMVPQLLRLLRPDGTLMLGQPDAGVIDDALAQHLVGAMAVKKSDRDFAKVCRQTQPDRLKLNQVCLHEGSVSEWGLSGVLQAHWTRTTPKVAFDFSDQQFRIEIGRRQPLVVGSCLPEIVLNGTALHPDDEFEVVCCEQNDDVDYVEVEMHWSDGLRLQRQILLSHEEEFLYVADALLPDRSAEIDYRCRWPLAAGIEAMYESETREVYLKNNKIQALVLPLALPEWKTARFLGQLEVGDGKLILSQNAAGRSLYAPLFFDLSPKRSKKKRTWRQLTIAEQLHPVPKEVAVAYRVQLNNQQWVVYRSLLESGNRTFIGENFSGEFFIGQFDRHGEVNDLLQIEV